MYVHCKGDVQYKVYNSVHQARGQGDVSVWKAATTNQDAPARNLKNIKEKMLISPLRKVQHPTGSMFCLCSTAAVRNKSFHICMYIKVFRVALHGALFNQNVDSVVLTKVHFINLTLYAPCIVLQFVYK